MSHLIRPAEPKDAGPLGRMGAALARAHHAYDPQRFMEAEGLEEGYASWLVREARNKKAVVLVAEVEGQVVGYGYARLEPRDWSAFRDPCGNLEDLWVEPAHRSGGLGAALAEALVARLRELGVPRVILHVAARNKEAMRFFAKLGWRDTMLEMTRETP